MAKVSNVRGGSEANQTMATKAIADANSIEYETDTNGRKIGVRRLRWRENRDLKALVGAVNSANESYMLDTSLACSVCEIDGEPVSMPRTELQINALLDRLDYPGRDAALKALMKLMPAPQSPEDEAAEIKNL